MWATQSGRSVPHGPGSAVNRTVRDRDMSGQGWESASLFQASSAFQDHQSHASPSQHQRHRVRYMLFPENIPSAGHTAPLGYTAAVPGSSPGTKNPVATHSSQVPVTGSSSSQLTPRTPFRPPTSGAVLQEYLHRGLNQRPSPWQGRSPLPPPIGFTSAASAGTGVDLAQLSRTAVVPSITGRYPVGSHALYRAGCVSAPAVQEPGPQQRTHEISPQRDESRAALTPRREKPRPTNIEGNSTSFAVFPDTTTLGAAPSGDQSSSGAAVSSRKLTQRETTPEKISPRAAEKTSPRNSARPDCVNSRDLEESGKQDNTSHSQKTTHSPIGSAQRSPSSPECRSAEGYVQQSDASESQTPLFFAEKDALTGGVSDGLRRRPVQGGQQEQAPLQGGFMQTGRDRHLVQGVGQGESDAAQSSRLSTAQRKQRSLWGSVSRLYHESLHLLQQDASELIHPAHLPCLDPFDLNNSELAQDINSYERSGVVRKPSGSTHTSSGGVRNLHGEKRRLSTGGVQTSVNHLLGTRSTTSVPLSKAMTFSAPHGFAVGVVSLWAIGCVLLAATLSFFFLQHHLRMFYRYDKSKPSNTDFAAGFIFQEDATRFPQTDAPSTSKQDILSGVIRHNEDLLVGEYKRVYTLCARGDLKASSARAADAADIALKSYLDGLKLEAAAYEFGRPLDKGAVKEDDAQMRDCADHDAPATEVSEKTGRATTLTEDILLCREGSRGSFADIVGRFEASGSTQGCDGNSSFVREVTDKNFKAYTTYRDTAEASASDETALMTAADLNLKNHFTNTMWLNIWCAVTAAVARMVLTFLLNREVTHSGPSQWSTQPPTHHVNSTWDTAKHVAADHLNSAHPSTSGLWERLKAEWRQGGNLLHLLPQMQSTDAKLPALPQLTFTANAPPVPSTPIFQTVWAALNRLATFQLHAAGFMSLLQFVAVAVILQPREELWLAPVVASTAAFLQLGMGIIDFICSDFNALTLLLGELFLKGMLLAIVHLGGQRLVQLSWENFVARITCRSRLPATASTAAAAAALLANACSAHGAAAAEVLLAEKRRKCRWGTSSGGEKSFDYGPKSKSHEALPARPSPGREERAG